MDTVQKTAAGSQQRILEFDLASELHHGMLVSMISAGAVLRDVALLRNVKRKSGSISMGLLFRQLVNWRMLLMARE